MITTERTVACSRIDLDANGDYIELDKLWSFDPEDYSRLKYGSRRVAEDMGTDMGIKLLEAVPELVLDKTPPEAVVIYKAVPPACHALSRFCMDAINQERVAQDLEPGTLVKVNKSSLIGFEYAASSPESRATILDSIVYDTDGHSFDGKPVIVVDDIRITGSAERRTRRTLDEFAPLAVIFGYIALMNEASANKDASIEDRINHTYVKDLRDVLEIIELDGFILNIRTLKRILSQQENEHRQYFLENISDELLYDIYNSSLASGPEFVGSPDYSEGFKQVEAYAKDRDIVPAIARH